MSDGHHESSGLPWETCERKGENVDVFLRRSAHVKLVCSHSVSL